MSESGRGQPHRLPTGLIYDRQGKPITEAAEFERLLVDSEYRVLALTQVGSRRVSTVWLGVDHSHGLGGLPVIFETAVFATEGGQVTSWEIQASARSRTEAEAMAEHEAMVATVRATTTEAAGVDPGEGAEQR